MSRITRDEMFIDIIKVIAKRSTCQRANVGAIIVKEGRVISMGYNGPVAGQPECTKCMGKGCDISLHAETNAIAFAARSGTAVQGCTMYCTMAPCINCAKVIVNSGITELVYTDSYRDDSGLRLLQDCGVIITKPDLWTYPKEDDISLMEYMLVEKVRKATDEINEVIREINEYSFTDLGKEVHKSLKGSMYMLNKREVEGKMSKENINIDIHPGVDSATNSAINSSIQKSVEYSLGKAIGTHISSRFNGIR